MQVSNHIFGSTDARDWRSVSKEIFLCNNLAHLPRHISSESTVEITVWAYLSESTVEQRAYQIKERGQNPSNCISVWFSQLFKQMCLYKIIPSHSCFTYSRGSVSAKYSPVTFDAVQLLPRSYTTVFDESKFYLPRRTAISRAAGGGGAIYIKLVNLRSRYK